MSNTRKAKMTAAEVEQLRATWERAGELAELALSPPPPPPPPLPDSEK